MIRELWHQLWYSYWYDQHQHLTARLDEIDAEERNLLADRERVRNRLNKAEAKCYQYARVI